MAQGYLARLFQTSRLGRDDLLGLGIVMAAICLSLWLAEALGGDMLRPIWALDRGPVLEGELFRLVTAHLVHLSRVHTVLNILGLLLVAATMWPILTGPGLVQSVFWSGAAISLGWVVLQPAGVSYVGFSGITHGVYAYGALHLLRRGPVWIGWVVLACLAVKIGHEAIWGPVPGAEAEIGGRVALLSHALGTFGGAACALGTPLRTRGLVMGLSAAAVVWQAV